jgi:hypothetical protein
MILKPTQLKKLNSTVSKHVLKISFIHVCKTQLYSNKHNTTQLNSTGVFRRVLNLKLTQLNSNDLRAPSPVLGSRDPLVSNMQITCKRGSAKHSVKDDHVFLWKHAIFRHLPGRIPSTDQKCMSRRLYYTSYFHWKLSQLRTLGIVSSNNKKISTVLSEHE